MFIWLNTELILSVGGDHSGHVGKQIFLPLPVLSLPFLISQFQLSLSSLLSKFQLLLKLRHHLLHRVGINWNMSPGLLPGRHDGHPCTHKVSHRLWH